MLTTMDRKPSDRAPRRGLAIRDPVPWPDLVEIVQTAEQAGYEALFVPESSGREAFSTLAGLSGHTEALLLGTGIVTIVARRPSTTAMAAATLHEISGGRLILGLGTGPMGTGALDRLRESVTLLRSALAGEEVETPGGGRFRLSVHPGYRPVPIWVAALNPRAMRLGGEVADGVLMNWCPPERVAFARERIREGAEAAGRDPASVTLAVYVRACVGQEPGEGGGGGTVERECGPTSPPSPSRPPQYATYPAYRRQFDAVGLGEQAGAAAEALAGGRPDRVPSELVRRVCLMGEAPEARAGLRAYEDAGADLAVVYPVATRDPLSSILGTLFALAPNTEVA
jgi:alkanesulfonate monooxygenase SsuD/methylene tetrahydromethanopterin reductase-like flavin-dependent oxidoreductase (luciferase family)